MKHSDPSVLIELPCPYEGCTAKFKTQRYVIKHIYKVHKKKIFCKICPPTQADPDNPEQPKPKFYYRDTIFDHMREVHGLLPD